MKKSKNRDPRNPFDQGYGQITLTGRTARRLAEREEKKLLKKQKP